MEMDDGEWGERRERGEEKDRCAVGLVECPSQAHTQTDRDGPPVCVCGTGRERPS